MNIRIVIMTVVMAAGAGTVWAKLPPAPAADPAKAAADAKKKAEGEKKAAETLSKAQDRAAANYRKNKAAKK
jgi:hypothetical protein